MSTERIVVTGGPWPERIGCHGIIASPSTAAAAKNYPWATTPKDEAIILLDDDPIVPPRWRPDGWTCTIYKNDIRTLPGRTA